MKFGKHLCANPENKSKSALIDLGENVLLNNIQTRQIISQNIFIEPYFYQLICDLPIPKQKKTRKDLSWYVIARF